MIGSRAEGPGRSELALALPASAARVIDSQLRRVSKAEAEVRSRKLDKAGIDRLLEAAGVGAEEAPDGVLAACEGAHVQLARGAREVHVIHCVAHLRTDGVFPPHGAQWARTMLQCCAELAPHLLTKLTETFVRHDVSIDPTEAADRALRRISAAAHRYPSALVRVILDDPPESVVGLLEGDSGDSFELLTGRGSVRLEATRLRYVARVIPVG